MSIDFYPAQDAEKAGIKTREDIGSASLFFRNESALFPEFEGKDLETLFPRIQFQNLAVDGATCEDLLSEPSLNTLKMFTPKRALITLTIGGNDLLGAFNRAKGTNASQLVPIFQAVQKRYQSVLRNIQSTFPNGVVMLTTVFDPTDGTGIIPSASSLYSDKLPIEFLTQFNNFVKSSANNESILLADVHQHFLGHGAECSALDQFWYWKPSPIEPSYRGASEIRRVWLMKLISLLERI